MAHSRRRAKPFRGLGHDDFTPTLHLLVKRRCKAFIQGWEATRRYKQGLIAKEFFMRLYNANCSRICIENPRPSSIYELPPATQLIQPCDFHGELNPYTKATLLWLKGLPPLKPVEPVEPIGSWCRGRYADLEAARTAVSRQIVRSKTFYGVAKAMAEQWGNLV